MLAATTSHSTLPSSPNVNQVAKIVSPWWLRLIPHPGSEFAGEFHQMPWKLVAAAKLGCALNMQVGIGLANCSSVIGFVCGIPFTV